MLCLECNCSQLAQAPVVRAGAGPYLDDPHGAARPRGRHHSMIKEGFEGVKVWLGLVQDVEGVRLPPPFLHRPSALTPEHLISLAPKSAHTLCCGGMHDACSFCRAIHGLQFPEKKHPVKHGLDTDCIGALEGQCWLSLRAGAHMGGLHGLAGGGGIAAVAPHVARHLVAAEAEEAVQRGRGAELRLGAGAALNLPTL
jgi:hypothetical protein